MFSVLIFISFKLVFTAMSSPNISVFLTQSQKNEVTKHCTALLMKISAIFIFCEVKYRTERWRRKWKKVDCIHYYDNLILAIF